MEMSSQMYGMLNQFFHLPEGSAEYMELSDSLIYMTPAFIVHQLILRWLLARLFHYFEGKDYEVFHSPFVEIQGKQLEGMHIVMPDLLVICDKKGLKEGKSVGAPSLLWKYSVLPTRFMTSCLK